MSTLNMGVFPSVTFALYLCVLFSTIFCTDNSTKSNDTLDNSASTKRISFHEVENNSWSQMHDGKARHNQQGLSETKENMSQNQYGQHENKMLHGLEIHDKNHLPNRETTLFEKKPQNGTEKQSTNQGQDKKLGREDHMHGNDSEQNLCQPYISGVGGNANTGKFQYGVYPNCLPPMDMKGEKCFFMNSYVVVMDAKQLSWRYVLADIPTASFTCSLGYNDPFNGGFSPATDAFRYTNDAIAMFRDWYTFSFPQPFLPVYVYVHVGRNWANALFKVTPTGLNTSQLFFNPKQTSSRIDIMLGDGRKFTPFPSDPFGNPFAYTKPRSTFPFTTPNIIGHEIGHALIWVTSLLSETQEAKSIHEAFADITGEVLEYYVTGRVDWFVAKEVYEQSNNGAEDEAVEDIGAQCMNTSSNDENNILKEQTNGDVIFIKNFNNPATDGVSVQHISQILPTSTIYETSGIFRYVFYLVSQTLGIKETYGAFLQASRLYWSANTGFQDGACGVLNSAKDLHLGIQPFHDAFTAVGIATVMCGDFPHLRV